MTRLDRLADWRRRLRDGLPLAPLQALFVALVLLLPYERLYRNFFYGLLLVPFLALADRRDWRHLSDSWVLRFCLAYLGLLWLCLLWTPEVPGGDLVRVGRHVASNLAFAALTAWLVLRDDRHVDRLCRWMAGAALVTALISLVLFYAAHPWDHRLAAWLWTNPNTAGAVFGLACVAAAAGPGLAAGRANARLAWLAIAGLLALAVALTGSRAAFAGVAASLVVGFALRRAWRPLAGVAGAALAVAALGAVGWITPTGWLARADNGRIELWSHFWAVAWQRPWLGWGLRHDLVFTIGNGLTTDDPHDMILATFMRIGLVGALSWLGLTIAALAAGLRHWRRRGDVAPLALMLYLVTQGLFESALPIDAADWFWIHLWIPIGVAAGVELRARLDAAG